MAERHRLKAKPLSHFSLRFTAGGCNRRAASAGFEGRGLASLTLLRTSSARWRKTRDLRAKTPLAERTDPLQLHRASESSGDLRPEALCATRIAPGVQFFSKMSVCERAHMAVEDDHDQDHAGRQRAVTSPRVDRTPCTRPSPQTIFIIFIILIVIIVILIILLGTGAGKVPEQPVCSCKAHACPSGWKAYEQKCYYFSDVEKNWTLSQSFCASQKASLVVLESEDEMHFVMGLKGKNSFWIGVSREPGQLHGNSSALDVSGNGGNCPCLHDEPKPNFLRCSNEHHFICAKTMEEAGAVPGVNHTE
ncbi:C-type lectin domain-containing protein [Podarcis lilfordi]|uniref:C-type lectin domain-containing protein n=1 Tax=Podarcis lilfordi TaxID=74358 RepID=A0AA35JXI5_9SAUR|nr:C-type lectin domain-containing protein [Podarcis lilfordi]